MVMPGDSVTLRVALQKPVALEPRMEFTMREGGRTVGAGRIVDLIR